MMTEEEKRELDEMYLREDTFRKERRAAKVEASEDASSVENGLDIPGLPAEGSDSEKKHRPVSEFLTSLLSGNILSNKEVRRAYPYMIFVAFLGFVYIANAFRTQYLYREHSRLTEQVKELRAKSMTIASEKMQAARQSRIMTELEARRIPLKESLVPNKVIPKRTDGGE